MTGRTRRTGPHEARSAVSDQGDHRDRTATVAEREVHCRVHSLAVVAEALDRGEWPAEATVFDQLERLVAAACRWQLVVELEEVAA